MTVELYTTFFRFTERPFTLLPDPDFLYWSKQHSRAFTILQYGVATRAPLTVITGEIGAGKTTLVQHLLASMDDTITIGLISNAQGDRGDLLRWVLYALDVPADVDADYITLFKAFQEFVIGEYSEGRYVVLVIDEAQNLSIEVLEELRMLTNINSNKHELLQLILVGQPELRDLISDPKLVQFAQRVTATYHLKPLNEEGTQDYIRHRLRHVGGSGSEFSEGAIRAIYMQSKGVPRVINKLCDLALVYAASEGRNIVGLDVIRELAADGLFVTTRTPDVTPRADTGVYLLTDPIAQPHNKAAE